MQTWYRIETSYACFAIAEQFGYVVKTAPIAWRNHARPLKEVLAYYRSIGAKIQKLED